jgi:hypothetical protein
LSKYGNFCKKKNALVQISLGFLLSPWYENLEKRKEKKEKEKEKDYDIMLPNGFF